MRRSISATILLSAITISAFGSTDASAQSIETGFLNRTILVDGTEYRYQIYVPREFRRDKSWPIILSLHGGDGYGSDGLLQTAGSLANAIRRHVERFPAIVVFPQSHADGTPGWQKQGGRAALAELEQAIIEFGGDRSRVYLTGASAGGNGSWYLASQYPERFAALIVICGWIVERRGATSGILYPGVAPVSEPDPYAAVARRVASLPIWIMHGDADKTVSVEESRRMFAALKAIGANVQYTELPGVDHNAGDPAYERSDLLAWVLQQQRR